jgi:hypothetical protein
MHRNKEMIFLLLQEEENAAADQDEHLTILTALLQMQADNLCNATSTHGGSKFVERARNRRAWRVMPRYTPIILPTMHWLAERNFTAHLG